LISLTSAASRLQLRCDDREDNSHSDPSLSNQELELGNVSIHAAQRLAAQQVTIFSDFA